MIVFTITKITNDSGEPSPRKMNFSEDAPFRTEILPTLFKIPEFSCGSVVWIDSGMRVHRMTLPSLSRPLMSPIRISNTGFNASVSDLLEDILSSKVLEVVNAEGDRFTVKRSIDRGTTSSSGSSNKNHDIDERGNDTGIKVTPVVMTAASAANKGELFAKVAEYVPRTVSSRL